METLCENFIDLLDKPEEYLRPSDRRQLWAEQTRNIYNFVKQEEEKHNLPASADSLERLNTDGLDTEQIWQLLELQNKTLLAAPDDLNGLDDVNLCFNVAKLISLAKYDKLLDKELELIDAAEDGDSLLSENSDVEEKSKEEESDDSNDDEDEGMGSSENMEEDELSDEELFKNASDIDGGLNVEFDDDSDNEEDNFDKFIAQEGMEDSDVDDDDTKKKLKVGKVDERKDPDDESNTSEDEEKEKIVDKGDPSMRYKKTEVDSKFFRLRECEYVADNDIIGDNYDADSEDIDLMEDIPDSEEDMSGVKYDAFFDGATKSTSSKSVDMLEGDERESDAEDLDNDHLLDEDQDHRIEGTDARVDDQDQDHRIEGTDARVDEAGREVAQLLGSKKKEEKSTFEKERERELTLMSTLEEDNISEKPWFLKGEAVSADRPENSTLEEQLEYNIVARQRPVITEDTTTLIERVILSRIKSKAWSDVQRVVKPNINPMEYKKKLLLDQEKSKKSLAEIYEQEYVKQQKQKKGDEKEEELPEHKEIREKMDSLFGLLDALSNYHYTPKMAVAEVKIQSNKPAVTMEEATPITASDATLLAPQEILAPMQGELRGESERTATDRKRSRRQKKMLQSTKAKRQKKNLENKMSVSAAGGKRLDAKTTLKFVEKAVKAGQIKLLDGQQNKAVKSSTTFFQKLQDTKNSNPKRKQTKVNKKNKGQNSAAKVLL